MNKLIYTITLMITWVISTHAQIGIEIETTEISPKAILDFPGDGVNSFATKGILLPYVTEPEATAGTEPGTIVYNATKGVVEIRDNTQWVPFSKPLKDEVNKGSYNNIYKEVNSSTKGVIVSDLENPNFNNVKGVLVLESNTKALALPKVDKIEDLGAVKAGTICYDVSRGALAVFNGEVWTLFN